MTAPILSVTSLYKSFPIKGGIFKRTVNELKAVENVSFDLMPGETLGIVGESGCGKTTLGRTLVRLYEPTSGLIRFKGANLVTLTSKDLKLARRNMQMIFQDPYSSLNPRMSVGEILREPLKLHKIGTFDEQVNRVSELLELVGLPQDAAQRFPHEFSGGQRQRISIARALALKPEVIIADEPVSALDVSIQSQILNLLVDLQKKLHLSLIFISHDLNVVKYISDRIAVMYLGKIVEIGVAKEVFEKPKHPYTQALLKSIPKIDPRQRNLSPVEGDVPSPANPPKGCVFHTRCPLAFENCKKDIPDLRGADQHHVACHLYG